MKTPMSSEIVNNWSLEGPPKHVLTISSLLEEERAKGREIGLIIDLSNHETLYAEDLTTALNVQYAHIQVGRINAAFHAKRPVQYLINVLPCSMMRTHCCSLRQYMLWCTDARLPHAAGGQDVSGEGLNHAGHEDSQDVLG